MCVVILVFTIPQYAARRAVAAAVGFPKYITFFYPRRALTAIAEYPRLLPIFPIEKINKRRNKGETKESRYKWLRAGPTRPPPRSLRSCPPPPAYRTNGGFLHNLILARTRIIDHRRAPLSSSPPTIKCSQLGLYRDVQSGNLIHDLGWGGTLGTTL